MNKTYPNAHNLYFDPETWKNLGQLALNAGPGWSRSKLIAKWVAEKIARAEAKK